MSKKLNPAQAESIRYEVEKLLSYSLESFGLDDIIDCATDDQLTKKEKNWAKKHLVCTIIILDDKE